MTDARRLIISINRIVRPAAALFAAWLCFVALPARADVLVTIDKATQKMIVEVNGATRWVWPVSTGIRGYDTPAGNFRPFRMEEEHYSKEWDDAPMPHSIFFTMVGHAIHGSFETRNLGRRASHGCVRISPANAEKLFALIKQEGMSNSRVVVREDSRAPIVAKRRNPGEETRKAQPARRAATEPAVAAAPAPPADADISQRSYGYVPAPSAERPTATIRTPLQIVPERY